MRGLWPVMLILARILEPLLGDDGCHRNDTDHAIPCQRSRELLLSRRRRLAFPQGSTFVVTASILQPIPVKLPSNWNMVFEFDVIWPIPTTEDYKKKYKNKYKYKRRQWMVKRRHRRELYATFEMALNSQNLPGRECTLRTICEARTLLSPPGDSFVEDALRLILRNLDHESK